MTLSPTEKANELIEKFKPYTFGWKDKISDHYAKQCALLCAEESLSIMMDEYFEESEAVQYRKQVINEIKAKIK